MLVTAVRGKDGYPLITHTCWEHMDAMIAKVRARAKKKFCFASDGFSASYYLAPGHDGPHQYALVMG